MTNKEEIWSKNLFELEYTIGRIKRTCNIEPQKALETIEEKMNGEGISLSNLIILIYLCEYKLYLWHNQKFGAILFVSPSLRTEAEKILDKNKIVFFQLFNEVKNYSIRKELFEKSFKIIYPGKSVKIVRKEESVFPGDARFFLENIYRLNVKTFNRDDGEEKFHRYYLRKIKSLQENWLKSI